MVKRLDELNEGAMTIEGDHRRLVTLLLAKIKPRKMVRKVIQKAYVAGYEKYSDGITLMPDYAMGMKHPAGVGHDFLYYIGMDNPFLPDDCETEWAARMWADRWFRDAMIDFGHPWRARIYFIGLRIGGWYGWRKHRKKGNPK